MIKTDTVTPAQHHEIEGYTPSRTREGLVLPDYHPESGADSFLRRLLTENGIEIPDDPFEHVNALLRVSANGSQPETVISYRRDHRLGETFTVTTDGNPQSGLSKFHLTLLDEGHRVRGDGNPGDSVELHIVGDEPLTYSSYSRHFKRTVGEGVHAIERLLTPERHSPAPERRKLGRVAAIITGAVPFRSPRSA